MSISVLIKTVVIPNAVAGEYKFEIFQDEHANFYADISRKNDSGAWVMVWDEYGFRHALDIDEAVSGCISFVDNLAIDHKAIEASKLNSKA